MNRNTFLPSQASTEQCQARLPGCTGHFSFLLMCETEGASMMVCHACQAYWAEHYVPRRCPRCAKWEQPEEKRLPPAMRLPLTGSVAVAVDSAMHKEGLLADVRTRVLETLAHEHPWLQYVRMGDDVPGNIVDRSNDLLTPEELARVRADWEAKRHGPPEVITAPDSVDIAEGTVWRDVTPNEFDEFTRRHGVTWENEVGMPPA
jgi:hypothetical protein